MIERQSLDSQGLCMVLVNEAGRGIGKSVGKGRAKVASVMVVAVVEGKVSSNEMTGGQLKSPYCMLLAIPRPDRGSSTANTNNSVPLSSWFLERHS